jgi:hypothetical protein
MSKVEDKSTIQQYEEVAFNPTERLFPSVSIEDVADDSSSYSDASSGDTIVTSERQRRRLRSTTGGLLTEQERQTGFFVPPDPPLIHRRPTMSEEQRDAGAATGNPPPRGAAGGVGFNRTMGFVIPNDILNNPEQLANLTDYLDTLGIGRIPIPPQQNNDDEEDGGDDEDEDDNDEGSQDNRQNDNLETGSIFSDSGQAGLAGLLTHIVKPVRTTLDKTAREDDDRLARGVSHLDRIKVSTVRRALRSDETILATNKKLAEMQIMMMTLNNEIAHLKSEQKITTLASSEKSGKVTPNPVHTYPSHDCSDESYQAAVKNMGILVKVIEKNNAFAADQYNHALEICASSNEIASNFGLSQEQQRRLILSALPSNSEIYLELSMITDLAQCFRIVSQNSSSLLTRGELELKIEKWTLDTRSYKDLTHSLLNLKILLIKLEDKPLHTINGRDLYGKILVRLRRERGMSQWTLKKLDEARVRIDVESDHTEMNQIILTALRDTIKLGRTTENHAVKNEGPSYLSNVANSLPALSYTPQTTPEKKGFKGKGGKKGVSTEPKGQPQRNQGNPKDSGKKSNDKTQPHKNSPRIKKKHFTVEPFPKGINYLSGSGNGLSRQVEEHFRNHCFKCGHSSHASTNCRIYPEKQTVMTLCEVCRSGFHLICKSYKYAPKQTQGNAIDVKRSPSQLQAIEEIVQGMAIAQAYRDGVPPFGQSSWYPYPPPPANN